MIFYLLDKNEKIIRMLPTNKCDFAVQELNLNGIYILNFDIDIKDLWIMEDIEYIIHKDIENKENFYMYKIISDGNNKDRLEFKAIYIAMDELESYSYITDRKPKKVKVSQAVNIVITNTRWELGEIDDSIVKSLNFYYCSPLKAITKIIDTYNVEINFRLKAEKNRIVKRLIDVKKQVGKFTGKRFFYGSNALEVIKETNNGSIYTKFIPRGIGEEVGDGFGRRIDIKDIVWSKDKGDPIDKPKGQEYIEFEDMTALYGHSDGTPRSTIVLFENIDDPKELIKVAYNYGLVNSRPQISYKSDVERIGRINLGDGVLIIRKDLNIRYVARVYKIIKDLKNPNKTKVELGDNRDISQSKKNMDFQKRLDNLDEFIGETNLNFVKQIQKGLTESMYNQESYRYESTPGDDSGLLSGTWYFNKPIDQNPDRALYLGGGHIAMANKKDSDGNWEFTTIANGDGVVADVIVAGILKGGNVRWNLEDGTFIIGDNPSNYSMYWDGSTLHLRNVDIDLENSSKFKQLEEDNQRTKEEIEQRKAEIAGALDRIAETRKEMERQGKSFNEEIYQLDEDLKKQIGTVKYDMTNLDEAVKKNKNDFITYKKERETKDVTLERELLEIKSNVQIANDKISTSVSSITRSVEAQLTETKSYAKNLLGESKTYTDRELSNYKTYVSNNYASLYQTDKLISASVGEIKVAADDAKRVANNVSSQLQITKNSINQKVSRNEIISEINQSPEQVKIRASKIDLEGNVDVTGRFKTKTNSSGAGLEIDYGTITWFFTDGYSPGKIFNIKWADTSTYNMVIEHSKKSMLSIAYDSKYGLQEYVTFDYYNNDPKGRNTTPVMVHKEIEMVKSAKFRGNVSIGKNFRLKPYNDGFGIENSQGNGIFINNQGEVFISRNKTLSRVATR